MAKDLDISMEKLKENLNFPHLLSVEKNQESLGEKLQRYVKNFSFVCGGPIATGIYFNKIFYLQNFVLETVANDAKVLLKKQISKDFEDSGQACLPQDVGNENGKSKTASS